MSSIAKIGHFVGKIGTLPCFPELEKNGEVSLFNRTPDTTKVNKRSEKSFQPDSRTPAARKTGFAGQLPARCMKDIVIRK